MASCVRPPGPDPSRSGRSPPRRSARARAWPRLHDPVAHRRDAPGFCELLPRALGDQPLARRQRTVGACLELVTELVEDTLHAICSSRARVWPSTPGGPRPPVAPVPRCHATSSVAGSQTKLNTSPKRACSSRSAHRCSLVCHPYRCSASGPTAARASSRPTSRTVSRAAVLLSAFAMDAPAPSDSYADSVAPASDQRASGLAGPPPAARRAPGASTFTMIRLTGSAAGCPYGTSGGHSQSPAGHHARVDQPAWSEPAVDQGSMIAVNDPRPPGFGSVVKSRGASTTRSLSLCFPVSASTRAGVWRDPPGRHIVRDTSPTARDPAPGRPPTSPAPTSARDRHPSRHG